MFYDTKKGVCMRVDSVNNTSINFQAKLINRDERIQKFVKSAYRTAGYDTFEILDKYAALHPDDITISYFSQVNDKIYITIKNGISGKMKRKEIKDADYVHDEDKMAFIDLLKQVMNDNSFWRSKK